MLVICDKYASDFNMAFDADKSKCLVVLSPSRRYSRRDASSLSHNEFRIDGRKTEIVSSYSHLGHIISGSDGDSLDIMKQKRAFNGQVNNMLCFFGKLPSVVKSRLFALYCTRPSTDASCGT